MQAVCDSEMLFTDVVARWPGSTHDSYIFNQSSIRDRFEDGELDGCLLGELNCMKTKNRKKNKQPWCNYIRR